MPLKFLHCFKDAEEWDRLTPSNDPHYSSALYRAFSNSGQLACLDGLVQPFYQQEFDWIGNVHNFGGPVGDPSQQAKFEQEFSVWKLLHRLNERCALNPFLTQPVSYPTQVNDVIYIDLNVGPKLRSTTRHCIAKAIKNSAVTWLADPTVKNAGIFDEIYHDSMQRKEAADHWHYRSGFFYDVLKELGPKRSALFFTSISGEIESGCILIFSPDVCYYHWAAAKGEKPDLGIGHLQVWSAVQWAQALHMGKFCLGGGDNSLMLFKRGFSDLRLPCHRYEIRHNSMVKVA